MNNRPKNTSQLIFGFGYGLALALLSFVLAGFGHGTYIPFAVSSAPFGVFGGPPVVIGALVLWPFAFRLAVSARGTTGRKLFGGVILLHYVGAVVSLTYPVDGDWTYFWKMMEFASWAAITWLGVYVFGQVLMWTWFLRELRTTEAA